MSYIITIMVLLWNYGLHKRYIGVIKLFLNLDLTVKPGLKCYFLTFVKEISIGFDKLSKIFHNRMKLSRVIFYKGIETFSFSDNNYSNEKINV